MTDYYYINDAPVLDNPLWWHIQGLTQTASGYGSKLTTRYMLPIGKRLYRVYCTQYSNAGTLWIKYKGVKFILSTLEHVSACQGINPEKFEDCIQGLSEFVQAQ